MNARSSRRRSTSGGTPTRRPTPSGGERVTAAVLVSTRLAEMGLALMTLRSTPAPLMLAAEGDDGREWQLEQCRQWYAGADDRRDNRRRFVGNAKVELATAPVSARLRVGARRVRGKLLVARYNLRKRLGRDG